MQVHSLSAAREKKKKEKLSRDSKIDDVIRLIVVSYDKVDKKLEEIKDLCLRGKDVKSTT
jgi:hypothetical protein